MREQRRSIGVRIARGAARGQMLRMVLRGMIAAGLAGVAFIATLFPAREATRVDPLRVLRAD